MTAPNRLATFFGKYLLERGIIDEKALEDALAEQHRQSTLLGDLAVDRGYMQSRDVEKVFAAQKDSDKPFGELAVEFGMLTAGQLEDLLFVQNVRTSHLGEVLLSKGAITETQFESVLEAFSRDERQGRDSAEQILQEHPQGGVLRCFIHAIESAFSRFMKERVKVCAMYDGCSMNGFDVEFRFELRYPGQSGKVCIVFLDHAFAREIAGRLSGEPQEDCEDECLAQCRGLMEVVERYLVADLARMGEAPADHRLKASFISGADYETASTVSVEMATPSGPMSLAVVVIENDTLESS